MTNREYINNLSNQELIKLLLLENIEDAPWDDYAFNHTSVFIGQKEPYKTYEECVAEWLNMERME